MRTHWNVHITTFMKHTAIREFGTDFDSYAAQRVHPSDGWRFSLWKCEIGKHVRGCNTRMSKRNENRRCWASTRQNIRSSHKDWRELIRWCGREGVAHIWKNRSWNTRAFCKKPDIFVPKTRVHFPDDTGWNIISFCDPRPANPGYNVLIQQVWSTLASSSNRFSQFWSICHRIMSILIDFPSEHHHCQFLIILYRKFWSTLVSLLNGFGKLWSICHQIMSIRIDFPLQRHLRRFLVIAS